MKISIAKLSQMKAIELRNKKQNKNWMGSMLRKEKTYWTHFWVQQNTKDTGLTFGSTRKQNILDPLLGPLENKTYWTYFWVHQKTKDTGPTFGYNRIQNILDPLLGPIEYKRYWTHFWVQIEYKRYWTHFWVQQKTKHTGPTFGSNKRSKTLETLDLYK